jgi:hypothetical protein
MYFVYHFLVYFDVGVFSFSGSSFKMKKDKESTARVVLRRQFDVTHSFTLEASFFGCDFGPHCGEHFSVDVSGTFMSNLFIFCEQFLALFGNRTEVFGWNIALVKPRQHMDISIFRIFKKSVRQSVSCSIFVFTHLNLAQVCRKRA